MTKTPGEVQPPKHLTKAACDAREAFRQVDVQKAMTEHETRSASRPRRSWSKARPW